MLYYHTLLISDQKNKIKSYVINLLITAMWVYINGGRGKGREEKEGESEEGG